MRKRYETVIGRFYLNPKDGITNKARIVFSRGQCHSLAVALHEITGWPIYGQPSYYNEEPRHLFVEGPNGEFLDIDGWDTYSDPQPFTKEQVLKFKHYKPCKPDAARPFAELVLKQYAPNTP